MFIVETHPYLNDQRTEVYDADGDVLGSIIWAGPQPSHICVYSEMAGHSQPFEMVPRGDPTVFVVKRSIRSTRANLLNSTAPTNLKL